MLLKKNSKQLAQLLNLSSYSEIVSLKELILPPEYCSGGLLYFLYLHGARRAAEAMENLSANSTAMKTWYYLLFQGVGDA